jgi:hypothetical protein
MNPFTFTQADDARKAIGEVAGNASFAGEHAEKAASEAGK